MLDTHFLAAVLYLVLYSSSSFVLTFISSFSSALRRCRDTSRAAAAAAAAAAAFAGSRDELAYRMLCDCAA